MGALPSCLYGHHMLAGYPQKSEESAKCPGTGIMDDCEPPHSHTGAGSKSWGFRKSSRCSELLNSVSSPIASIVNDNDLIIKIDSFLCFSQILTTTLLHYCPVFPPQPGMLTTREACAHSFKPAHSFLLPGLRGSFMCDGFQSNHSLCFKALGKSISSTFMTFCEEQRHT